MPAGLTEALPVPATPAAVAALALAKAQAVAAGLAAGVVLGADTEVVLGGEPLGKPADPEQARAMLRRLRGRVHEVITGLALVEAATGRRASTAVVSRVVMRDYPDEAIVAYVASGEGAAKAGGYAIQGRGADLVAGYVGSYTNIVGLPLAETRRMLVEFGIVVRERA